MRASFIVAVIFIVLLVFGIHQTRKASFGPPACTAAPPTSSAPADPRWQVAVNKGDPLWKAEVSGGPKTTAEAARQDALNNAADKLGQYMREHYLGYRWSPTAKFLTDHGMVTEGRNETQVIKDAPEAPPMVRHTLAIELRETQLKQLLNEDRRERGIERMWQAGRGLGGVLVMLVALVAYLRLDDWTKGYLSLPLKLGALSVAIAGPVVLWWLV
jgi:hypothetical protein